MAGLRTQWLRSRRFPCPGGGFTTLLFTAAAWLAAWWMPALGADGRLALGIFGTAVAWWATTGFPPGWIAMAGAAVLAGVGIAPPSDGWEVISAGAVWLVIAAFVIGAAVTESGLAERLSRWMLSGTATTGGAMWRLSALLAPLAWVVPSTSGRAAIALSAHRAIVRASGGNPMVARALSLLAPSVILTTTIISLTGAGSHLVANDLLHHATGRRISFMEWIVYGLPFGLAAGAVTVATILLLSLDRNTRVKPLLVEDPSASPRRWSSMEMTTLAVLALLLALWMTTTWHGIPIAASAVVAAFIFSIPRFGPLGWGKAFRAIPWELVAFVVGALVLGNALIDTGAATAILGLKLRAAGMEHGIPWYGALLPVALVTLTSHLYITSHIARAAALVPPLLAMATTLGLDPVGVVFIGTVGMNFCLTFPVSSKALLMFRNAPGGGFTDGDLLRVSLVSGAAHMLLIGLFHLTYWKWTGLTL